MGGDKKNRRGWCGRNEVSHGPHLFYLWGERGEVSWRPQLLRKSPFGTPKSLLTRLTVLKLLAGFGSLSLPEQLNF